MLSVKWRQICLGLYVLISKLILEYVPRSGQTTVSTA